jgi:SpoVK/Ycf46/Vps4 family AAA+-type ATPase
MFINEVERYRVLDTDFTETFQILPSGVYDLEVERTFFGKNLYLKKNESYQKGVQIKTGIFKQVWDYTESFYSIEKVQTRGVLKMKNKLGLMFNGTPGTGKTFLAGQIAQYYAEKEDAIGVLVNQGGVDFAGLVDVLRRHDKNRKIVIIIDEFEKNYDGKASELLSFLDGSASKEDVIIIATTNKYKHLPDYLIDRPGRFEKIFTFDVTEDDVIKSMIKALLTRKYYRALNIGKIIRMVKQQRITSIDKIRMILKEELEEYFKKFNAKYAVAYAA